jgi:ubiquinone/menaquinone biosynthesis C-methylase UbiE/uncharacterized protein YbaR (Trm112 family)
MSDRSTQSYENSSARMRDVRLVCPGCGVGLEATRTAYACARCTTSYPILDGIPVLTTAIPSEQTAKQGEWFDEEVDSEWEIERPSGAPAFHEWLLTEKFRRSVAEVRLDGVSVLTVCGGSGMDAEFLAHAGASVISSDISLGAARRARERARRHRIDIKPLVADVERLPFADRSVDVVFVHDGLHHLERPLGGLAEMARVARHAVCISEPARAFVTALAVRARLAQQYEAPGNRVARLKPGEVKELLEASGFRVARAERYAMYYRHRPGRLMRVLSYPVFFQIGTFFLNGINVLAGNSIGNKLAIVAVRD